MGYHCDRCDASLRPDVNGYFVGEDGTSDCPGNERGHTWEGRTGI